MKWSGRYEGYDAAALRKDLISGVIVGIIAIPLGMAFAIASGVKPEYGIYTTVIAGILISLLGGSKLQIGGPTGAFIPILFAIVMQYGYENLLIAGMMAGVILVIMGFLKLGALIKFVPRPVTTGFTAGIAVIIFTGQISNFFGLQGIRKHEYFLPNMKEIIMNISAMNLYCVLTAAVCFAVMLVTPRFLPKVPGSLIGLIISALAAAVFFQDQVDTIGSTYGAIPSSLPQFHFPDINMEKVQMLAGPALIIAALGGIESLLSAVVADAMTGERHNSNRELIGQGVANIVTPLFGGIPATGAIARTATNVRNGAVSPMSGIIHSCVVLLVMLLFAPYASYIPLASMAPILMLVAWNMSDRKEFVHLLKTRTSDSIVLIITFLLTVLTDLTTAVEAGLILAVLLFFKRMSGMLDVVKGLPDHTNKHEKVRAHMVTEGHDCPQIGIYTITGPLFFGAANMLEKSIMEMIRLSPKILILRMGKVPMMDTSAASYFANLVAHFKKFGGTILISGIQPRPLEVIKRTGLYEPIGAAHFFAHTGEAINYGLERLDKNKCLGCAHYAFHECTSLAHADRPDHPKHMVEKAVL